MKNEAIKMLQDMGEINTQLEKPQQQSEVIELINNLIFEYMDWMRYTSSNTTFIKGKIQVN